MEWVCENCGTAVVAGNDPPEGWEWGGNDDDGLLCDVCANYSESDYDPGEDED